jgi:hypothetical protein
MVFQIGCDPIGLRRRSGESLENAIGFESETKWYQNRITDEN